MSKGSDKRPHDARKYGAGYDDIDWDTPREDGEASHDSKDEADCQDG